MKQTIQIYDYEGMWLFDDYKKDIVGEPFVEGSSEIIYGLMKQAGINEKSLALTFSDAPFLGYHDVLTLTDSRECGTWTLYTSEKLHMEGWLCPVLFQYFDMPPVKLYVKVTYVR